MATRPKLPSRRAPVLLERESELERATAAIEQVCSGTGAVVVLEGPAGIGKTELVRAVRRLALDAGMEALNARGDDLERDFAYGVLRQLFEPVGRGTLIFMLRPRNTHGSGRRAHRDA
jgi:predicted ATPase